MKNAVATPIRLADFVDWYGRNRKRSAELFAMIEPEAFYGRPIPLRHPIAFYEGHLPAFSYITLVRDTLGKPSIDARLERLFQRGIDPADANAASAAAIDAWPSRDEVRAFADACDAAIVDALRMAQNAAPSSREVQAAYTILEHEPMHHETLLYIFHRLPLDAKIPPNGGMRADDGHTPRPQRIRVAAGDATLGTARDLVAFGWDNEFQETVAHVEAFEIDAHSVTNADYLRFVKAGGPVPPFWIDRDGDWRLKTMFAEIELPRSWPVYVSQEQANAYALWSGGRLPTEAEYHRSAFGSPAGDERRYPWGEAEPASAHGNFDFERWDPVPAGSHPAGVSAWGVHDLIGNGWEWTASAFQPFPGFAPMRTYPQYSADFFDGQHFVVKGASAVTSRELIRRSLRNWYRPNYPYIYAKFRCVS